MEKNYIIEKCLFDDILEDVFVELAEKAQKWEIPKWGSYDVDRVEKTHPITDYHVSLHEGPVENPGEVVATAYIHTIAGEGTAEVTVSWEEGFTPIHIRLENLRYERLRDEAHNTRKSQAEIIREALELYWAERR